ncbi:hypothetical protein TYRP_015032 [Tyrophagus putrescentiae]|nr:hypothetical protein TYRP_015032 [Tyrophagus putrescentiae]
MKSKPGGHFFFKWFLSISSSYITHMVKSENEKSIKGRPWLQQVRITIYYGYSLLLIVRILLCAVALNSDTLLSGFFDYDPLFELYARRLGFIDRYLALVLWPGPLLLLHVDYLATFSRRLGVYHLAYDLVVLNRRHFWALNQQLTSFGAFTALLLQKAGNEKECCARERAVKLGLRKLPAFHCLDRSVRIRLALLATVFDFILLGFVLFIGGLAVYYNLSMVVPTWQIYSNYSWTHFWLITTERALVLYVFWHGATIAFVFILAINLILYAFIVQQRRQDRRLASLLSSLTCKTADLQSRSKVAKRQSNLKLKKQYKQFAAFLRRYLRQHLQLIVEVIKADRQIISHLLLTVTLTIFGLNVYAVAMLSLTWSMSTLQQTLLIVLCIKQFVFIIMAMWPMMVLTSELHHRPSMLLFRSQGCLAAAAAAAAAAGGGGSDKSAKQRQIIQVATYFEVLNSEQPFAFSAGPIGQVTKSALFETYQKRPPPRASLAPLARPSSADVLATANARRLGPCSLRSQSPKRRALAVAQVKPDLAALCRAPLPYIYVWASGSP